MVVIPPKQARYCAMLLLHTGCIAQAQQLIAISSGSKHKSSYIMICRLNSSQAIGALKHLGPLSAFIQELSL